MSSRLLLVRVVPPITLMDPTGGLFDGSPELLELYEEQPELAVHYLQEVIERLGAADLHIDTRVTEGDPAECIISYMQEHPEVAAVAMSTHGRSGLGRWLFGSVAAKVLHSSPVPLLLVRPEAEPRHVDLAAIPHYKTLLVPLDSSPFAEQALGHAQALAQAVDGRLVLVSVSSTPFDLKLVKSDVGDKWCVVPWDAPAEHLVEYLNNVTQKLAGTGVHTQAWVTYGGVADDVLKAAKRGKADLIVMSTHDRSELGHLLAGSNIATQVAQAANVPLLLVRAK
jgi:nucleotide-binding universal stress UspA family protein